MDEERESSKIFIKEVIFLFEDAENRNAIKTKNKKFDCVEMKHDAQVKLLTE